ncbi:unnamed protein product [Mytilus edulis]|uniref:WSC domain-containing protein n=1 Tax=Mytilus edulis TaxID=6550 RepID=A0A8S3VNH2_MYTED|nr:unnamed protein product [Mytilus edulis]
MTVNCFPNETWTLVTVERLVFWPKQDLLSLKTKWVTYLGCFGVNELTDLTKVQLTIITNNQPKTCSRHCMKWNFFALLDHKCFCFDEVMLKNLRENMLNRCHRKCPDYTDNMYCGSLDMQYANVYKREPGLPADVQELNFDCLIVNRQEGQMSIKQILCDKTVSFICSGHISKPIDDKLTFMMAKHYCENFQSKLMNLNDIVPPKSGDNVSYWVGTFRQRIYRHDSGLLRLFSVGETNTQKRYTKLISFQVYMKQQSKTIFRQKNYTTIYIHKEKTTPGILRVTHEENTQKKVNQSTCNVNQGFSEREVYVYTVGFGGVLILNISAVSIFLCCRKYKAKQHHQDKTIAEQNDNSTNEEEITRFGGSYESIIDDITSGSEVLSSRIQNSEYLHPYTTFTDRKETHSYCTKINFHKSSNTYSVSNLPKVASRYTHPVKQLEHEHTEVQTIPKSNDTELHTVHYLELVDVSNNT